MPDWINLVSFARAIVVPHRVRGGSRRLRLHFGFDFPQRGENLPLWLVSKHISDKSRSIACRVATSRPARMSPNTIEWVDRLAPVKTLPFGMSWKTTLTNERGAPVASE
jgi:hypothetical protein